MARVAVIGGGLAGAAAAVRAAEAGADVVMINAGGGATMMSSGAIDVAGDTCAPSGRPELSGREVEANLSAIMASQTHHPYTVLAGDPKDVLDDVKETLFALFPDGGDVKFEGDGDKNLACYSTLGTLKLTCFCPAGTAGPEKEGMERPLALSFARLLDFDPAAWAKVAAENAERLGIAINPCHDTVRLGLDIDRQAPAISAEIKDARGELLEAIKSALKEHSDATALVLPPVLPLEARDEIMSELSEAISIPVYELLGMPPSVHGLGFGASLRKKLDSLGIEFVRERATGFAESDERVAAVTTAHGRQIDADAFVLATGKFLGGGIDKDPCLHETLFRLPVFKGEEPLDKIFVQKLVGLHVSDRHVLFEIGLRVDEKLRPLDQDGLMKFKNLFAAGSVLSGYNYVTEGTGSGVALATGSRAGRNAAAK